MAKKLLINAASEDQLRVAMVEDGLLQEVGMETSARGQISGNIYKAVVERLDPSLNAAFVNYGGDRNGFLPADDVHPKWYKAQAKRESNGYPFIRKILERNQQLIVQVSQDPRGHKGALLTTFVSLPGRFLVLMPYKAKNGVSRKIQDEAERERLKKVLDEINPSEDMGFIARTAAEGKSKNELQKEARALRRLWQGIAEKAKTVSAPVLLYQETNLAIRTIRDYLSPDVDEILVDDQGLFQEIQDFFRATMPKLTKIVKLYKDKTPLFNKYQIEAQIESIHEPQVRLKSGGTIVITPTEALVAIDVNTGKTTVREDPETTAFKTNLEATQEIARQLRLRDLGGLIVVDFIDMENKKHRAEVEKAFKEAFKGDKARVRMSKISQFGLLEMSRQRLKPPLESRAFDSCPFCKGSGKVKSAEAQALQVLRKIQGAAAKRNLIRVEGELPQSTGRYLLNDLRKELADLEREFGVKVMLDVQPGPPSQEATLRLYRAKKTGEGETAEEIRL
ncbi:MAG: Rne/Rng family ribonuclease [Thermodesulfobacteriota bacterium]